MAGAGLAAPRRPAGPPAASSSSSSEHPGHDDEDTKHQHHRHHHLLHRRQHHGRRLLLLLLSRLTYQRAAAPREGEAPARLPLPPAAAAPPSGLLRVTRLQGLGGKFLAEKVLEKAAGGVQGRDPSRKTPAAGAMRPWVAVLALWEVLRAAAGRSPALPSMVDEAFIEACVRVHNELCAEVQPAASNMRYMVGTGLGGCGWLQSPAGGSGRVGRGSLGSPRVRRPGWRHWLVFRYHHVYLIGNTVMSRVSCRQVSLGIAGVMQ